MSCEEVQRRLDEAALGRTEFAETDRDHAAACSACGAQLRFLTELAAELDGVVVPALPAAALEAARSQALWALGEERALRGYARDVARALAVALVALPVAVVHGWLVARGAVALLGGVLPVLLLDWLGAVYFGSTALVLGVVYGSIPLLVLWARRQEIRRQAALEPA